MANPLPDLSPVYDALRAAAAAGDTAGAQKLAAYIQSQSGPKFATGKSLQDDGAGNLVPTGSPQAQAANSPIAGTSELDRFRTGMGRGFVDLARGAGQMVGLESREDVANSRQRDAPLMATGAGKWGDVAGTVAGFIPAAFIPGANTMAGAAAIGAGSGLMAPSTSTGETIGNTVGGVVMGPAALGAGRAAGALYNAGKGLVQPLFAKGQQSIAASTLQGLAGDPAARASAIRALQNPPSILPGVQPTTAELANNGGLSQLERSVFNNPQEISALTARNQANQGAMTQALNGIAGTPQDMAQSLRTRSQLTSPLYDSAAQTVVPADKDLGALLARPSMVKAWDRAQTLASEQGISLRAPNANDISGQTLQYLKMGLNDMLETADQKGIGAHEQNALKSTLAGFNSWTMKNVPQLRAADASYADLSRPINQMQIGATLRDKLLPALSDFGANPRLNANSFAGAVRNGDQLAATATGQPNLGLSDVLNPGQMQTVQQVGQQLARRVNAQELGRAVGSNTAQNLISQNFMRQVAGPLGLPSTFAQSTLATQLGRPIQWAGKLGQDQVTDILRRAALDPAFAAKLLQAQKNTPLAKLIWARQGALSSLGAAAAPVPAGLLGNFQQQ